MAKATQLGLDVVSTPIPKTRVTQAAVDVIARPIPKTRVTQVALDVIRPFDSTPMANPVLGRDLRGSFSWWDGSSFQPIARVGWWDGTQLQELAGFPWNVVTWDEVPAGLTWDEVSPTQTWDEVDDQVDPA